MCLTKESLQPMYEDRICWQDIEENKGICSGERTLSLTATHTEYFIKFNINCAFAVISIQIEIHVHRIYIAYSIYIYTYVYIHGGLLPMYLTGKHFKRAPFPCPRSVSPRRRRFS